MTVDEARRIGATYYKLAAQVLDSIPKDDPTGDHTLHKSQAFCFLVALGNLPLKAFMEEGKNNPNAATRYWSNEGLNRFRNIGLKNLLDDGTLLN